MNAINTNLQSGQQNLNSDAHQRACEKVSIQDVLNTIPTLKHFLSAPQLATMADACRGEEREYFKSKFIELFQTVTTMPKTYEQDGLGDEAVAHLHYFFGDIDYYITERDAELLDQRQAFGLACMWEQELGYVSIRELVANNFELDIHWKPQTLREIKRKKEIDHALNDFNSKAAKCHY